MVFYKIDAVMVGDDSQVEMNRQQQKPTQLNDDGKLVRPETGFKSLIRLILRKPIAEKDAVKIILCLVSLLHFAEENILKKQSAFYLKN